MRRFMKVGGRPQRRLGMMVVAAIAGFAVAALVAGMAIAKSSRPTVKTAHNATLGESIVVGSNGMTVYELAHETRHHLLCTSSACLAAWPLVTVHSAKAKLHKTSGVRGKLAVLHRNGFFQVTLNGRPLYFFVQDTAKGDANGQGIANFHVVKASGSTKGTASTSTPSTSTMTPYSY
jgi:predicted lipoprotein with Yx(FWY)xxD motif